MATSVRILGKNPFNLLLCFKQQNALRGLVTARCSVLALRSKQVKLLHFLFLPWASFGRRLAPELWARVILAGLGSVLVPWSEANETGLWVSRGKRLLPDLQIQVTPCTYPRDQSVTLLMKIVPFISLQKGNPEATRSPWKGHGSSSFGARKIPLK